MKPIVFTHTIEQIVSVATRVSTCVTLSRFWIPLFSYLLRYAYSWRIDDEIQVGEKFFIYTFVSNRNWETNADIGFQTGCIFVHCGYHNERKKRHHTFWDRGNDTSYKG